MKRLLAVLLVGLISFSNFKIAEAKFYGCTSCGPNEELKDQGSDCADCINYTYVKCAPQNVTKCYCNDGYIRTSDTDPTCVQIEDCPNGTSCGPNEELKDKGFDCANCINYKYVKCALENVTKCYCKEGYIRTSNTDSTCVKIEDCPKCPKNQVMVRCKNFCPATCQTPYPKPCAAPKICKPDCQCDNGYILSGNDTNATCVTPESCKEYCLEGQEFNECGSACPPTCREPSPEVCTLQCVVGCFCKKGSLYDEKAKKCVANEKECT